MGLAGVQIMAAGKPEPMAELRLQDGRAVAVSGGRRAGVADMLTHGIELRRGDLAAVARTAKRHGVRLPELERGDSIYVGPDRGELFLLGILSRYARPTGYSWAKAVRG